MTDQEMRVMKRDGKFEDISFDKILNRVKNLGNNMEPKLKLNYSQFVMDVIEQLYPDIFCLAKVSIFAITTVLASSILFRCEMGA